MVNKKKTYISPYHPYPFAMRGRFCEKKEGDKTFFIEIYEIKYDPEDIEKYKQLGVWEETETYEYLSLLVNAIDPEDEVFFLYKIQTYYADPTIEDHWEFNKSITSYEQCVFSNFDTLMDYVHQRWGIELNDFVPVHETHIPY